MKVSSLRFAYAFTALAALLQAVPFAAEPARPANHAARPKAKTPDLDLTLDFPAEDGEAQPRAPGNSGDAPSRAWVYWAAGAGAAAAAGGLGWYWHETQSKPIAPVRSEQVFTDER